MSTHEKSAREKSAIVGGGGGPVTASYAAIVGGHHNTVSGDRSVILGGHGVTLTAADSVALGCTDITIDGDPGQVWAGNARIDTDNPHAAAILGRMLRALVTLGWD